MHANPPYYCLSAYGEAYPIPSGRDGAVINEVRLLVSRGLQSHPLEKRAITAQFSSLKLPVFRP